MRDVGMKPCPFCGTQNDIIEVTVCDTVIRCDGCPCIMTMHNPREGDCADVITNAWNRRTPPEAP